MADSSRKRSPTLPRTGPETGKGRSLNLLPETEISQLRSWVSVVHFSDHVSDLAAGERRGRQGEGQEGSGGSCAHGPTQPERPRPAKGSPPRPTGRCRRERRGEVALGDRRLDRAEAKGATRLPTKAGRLTAEISRRARALVAHGPRSARRRSRGGRAGSCTRSRRARPRARRGDAAGETATTGEPQTEDDVRAELDIRSATTWSPASRCIPQDMRAFGARRRPRRPAAAGRARRVGPRRRAVSQPATHGAGCSAAARRRAEGRSGRRVISRVIMAAGRPAGGPRRRRRTGWLRSDTDSEQ